MIEQYLNTQELRRLLSSLIVFIGILVIAGLFAIIVVPGLRNANQPLAPTPVNPVVGEPGWLDPTEFPPEKGKEIPPVDAKVLITYSPKWIARGNVLFTRDCEPCHGRLGQGDGPAAATMNPRPRNFTNPNGWTNGYDLPEIYKTLNLGIKGTSMASFSYMSKSDRMALAHYVQAFSSFPHGSGSPEALEALSKDLAVAGEKTANKIPVSMAMVRLEQEFKMAPPLIIDPADRSVGAEVLRRVLIDPSRAALVLAGSQSWQAGSKELALSIVSGAPANGFSVAAGTLSAEEWKILYSELRKRMKQV